MRVVAITVAIVLAITAIMAVNYKPAESRLSQSFTMMVVK